ncbi:hypothetical protein T484DRAFT_2687198 [Baffinella frigidus]|nr:hypothetical protein T484DRAFT_2687198 [Cryptophyta sp. CCMP2293]
MGGHVVVRGDSRLLSLSQVISDNSPETLRQLPGHLAARYPCDPGVCTKAAGAYHIAGTSGRRTQLGLRTGGTLSVQRQAWAQEMALAFDKKGLQFMHAQKAWCATHGEWRAGPWDQSGCNGGRTPRELLMDQLPSADALSKVMEQCNVDDGKLQDLNLLGAKPYPPGHCMFVAIDANSTIAKKCGKRKATTVADTFSSEVLGQELADTEDWEVKKRCLESVKARCNVTSKGASNPGVHVVTIGCDDMKNASDMANLMFAELITVDPFHVIDDQVCHFNNRAKGFGKMEACLALFNRLLQSFIVHNKKQIKFADMTDAQILHIFFEPLEGRTLPTKTPGTWRAEDLAVLEPNAKFKDVFRHNIPMLLYTQEQMEANIERAVTSCQSTCVQEFYRKQVELDRAAEHPVLLKNDGHVHDKDRMKRRCRDIKRIPGVVYHVPMGLDAKGMTWFKTRGTGTNCVESYHSQGDIFLNNGHLRNNHAMAITGIANSIYNGYCRRRKRTDDPRHEEDYTHFR